MNNYSNLTAKDFHHLQMLYTNEDWLSERAISGTMNTSVDAISRKLLQSLVHGCQTAYKSVDRVQDPDRVALTFESHKRRKLFSFIYR